MFFQCRGQWDYPYQAVSGTLNPTIMPTVDQTSAAGLYNPATGYFTVPSAGTYVFSWSARFYWHSTNSTTNHPGGEVALFLNDSTAIVQGWTGASAVIGRDRWQVMSKSWVVKVVAGDRLALRCRDGGVPLALHYIDMQGMRIA